MIIIKVSQFYYRFFKEIPLKLNLVAVCIFSLKVNLGNGTLYYFISTFLTLFY